MYDRDPQTERTDSRNQIDHAALPRWSPRPTPESINATGATNPNERLDHTGDLGGGSTHVPPGGSVSAGLGAGRGRSIGTKNRAKKSVFSLVGFSRESRAVSPVDEKPHDGTVSTPAAICFFLHYHQQQHPLLDNVIVFSII